MILIAGFLAVLAIAAILLWSLETFARATPRAVVGAIKLFGASFIGMAGFGLLTFGRYGLVAALIGALVLTAWRLRAQRRPPDPLDHDAPSDSSGQSAIDTEWLSMRLDRATGEMDGRVRRGAFAGQNLHALEVVSLLLLRDELELNDPASLPLIETWLDRATPGWRAREDGRTKRGSHATFDSSGMDEATALDILGLQPGAERAEIEAAYRRVMGQVHPDRGGSNRLASLVNAARTFLLDRA